MSRSASDSIRCALAGKSGREWWRSLEDLAGSPEFREHLLNEFPRQAAVWEGAVDRRSVLRFMGASFALAGLTGCGQPPAEEIVPHVRQPEYEVPGVPRYYATAVSLSGYGEGVLGETWEGRPTRLSGNPNHPVSQGASSVFAQAAVLGLYDPDRSQGVRHQGRVESYDRLAALLLDKRRAWQANGGRGLRLVTGRLTSPSLLARIEALRKSFPELRWYRHEAVDRQSVEDGSRLAFGRPLEPRYHLREARVVLSLDADFLAPEEPAHLIHARDFAAARGPDDTPPARLYALESTPGLAGAAADHRLGLPAHRVDPLARALVRRLGVDAGPKPSLSDLEAHWLDVVARDLQANRGRAPVIPGSAQPASLHALAQLLNRRLDNSGRTVTLHEPVAPEADGDLGDLADELADGSVDTLVALDCNPLYTAPAELELAKRLTAGRMTFIHGGLYFDETAHVADWHVPMAHELESWGDVRACDGTASLQQPLIRPLHGGRSALQLVAALGGDFHAGAQALVRAHWQDRAGDRDFERFWRQSLKRGVVDGSASPEVEPPLRDDLAQRLAEAPQPPQAEGLELRLRPDFSAWDGRFANNGWLQELPRPLTKLVWNNALLVGPALAKRLDLESGRRVRLSAAGRSLEVPVWVTPGQPEGSVALSLGYGRARAGRIGSGLGADAYRLRRRAAPWFAGGFEITKLEDSERLVVTQDHHAMEGRDLIRDADWPTYQDDPTFAQRADEELPPSLYPEPSPSNRRPDDPDWTPYDWGMAINLDACIGCNACVIACQSENNIPIVGPEEVSRGREMHWLRIDRYYQGVPDAPNVSFQPVPCMHCENAPCEYVCPVEATQHSSEGLNEMIYNRCIGTRYCSQNCPYKVRRFNWFDYTSADADYPAVTNQQNPDVTVRGRGVMEKCTYCVQRINRARIAADREGRTIGGDEVTTACQDACPTSAIVFGDTGSPDSTVSAMKLSPRNYELLGDLNTRPRTTYIARVRDPNPELAEALEDSGDGDAEGSG